MARPPTHTAAPATWTRSKGMARAISDPVPAWPASPGVTRMAAPVTIGRRWPPAGHAPGAQEQPDQRHGGGEEDDQAGQVDLAEAGVQHRGDHRRLHHLGQGQAAAVGALDADGQRRWSPPRRSGRPTASVGPGGPGARRARHRRRKRPRRRARTAPRRPENLTIPKTTPTVRLPAPAASSLVAWAVLAAAAVAPPGADLEGEGPVHGVGVGRDDPPGDHVATRPQGWRAR